MLLHKIKYNSPVILTFALVCGVIMIINEMIYSEFIQRYFVVGTEISEPLDWFRIFSHVLGHAGWGHFSANMTLFLLLGPVIEERYGSFKTLTMILITAGVTGLVNVTFMSSGLVGASGIVFMLIILTSIVNTKRGEIPITFVLVAIIWLGHEILDIRNFDGISHFGHILGGVSGSILGFYHNRTK